MSIWQIWPIGETVVILAIFGFMLFRMWRIMKARAKNPTPRPTTRAGRFKAGSLYVLRLVGLFVGSLLALTLFIMVERNILLVMMDTAPAHSTVTVPDDLGFEVEEVAFEGGDGLHMAGWYIPPQNGVVIILLHGYGNNRTSMIWHAGQLVRAGYGVLMYDERASGESEGTYRSYGWEDPRDVAGAIRFIEARQAEGQNGIGIAGCSTGADVALVSAAANPELGAVWADGASMVRVKDLPKPKSLMTALMFPGQTIYEWMLTRKLGIQPPAPLIDVIDKIAPRSITLVGGGTARPLVGSEAELFTLRLAKIAGDNAQAWVIPEATHCDGPRVRPEEYAAKMVAFFDAAFGIKP